MCVCLRTYVHTHVRPYTLHVKVYALPHKHAHMTTSNINNLLPSFGIYVSSNICIQKHFSMCDVAYF